MTVNTKTAERRELRFGSLADVLADAEAVTGGPHRTTGNWTAAQIVDHVAELVRIANHGAGEGDARVTLPVPGRVIGRILKWTGGYKRPVRAGFQLPASTYRVFNPPADVSLDEAMGTLREQVAYAAEHGMTHPSPFFGRMTHEQWVQAHCRHAELHFSFMHPA